MITTGNIAPIISIITPERDHYQKRIIALESAILSHPLEYALPFLKQIVEAQQISYLNISQKNFSYRDETPYIQDPKTYLDFIHSNLIIILDSLTNETKNESIETTINELKLIESSQLEEYIEAIFMLNYEAIPAPYRIFINAALQVILYTLSTKLVVDQEQPLMEKSICPCCGMPAIASVIDQKNNGLRYLSCSYCETKWHYVRSQCTECQSGKSLELITLEDATFAMKVETCGECDTYIKHIDRTKTPNLDIFIEDILSLTLDIALNDEGFVKRCVNPYLA